LPNSSENKRARDYELPIGESPSPTTILLSPSKTTTSSTNNNYLISDGIDWLNDSSQSSTHELYHRKKLKTKHEFFVQQSSQIKHTFQQIYEEYAPYFLRQFQEGTIIEKTQPFIPNPPALCENTPDLEELETVLSEHVCVVLKDTVGSIIKLSKKKLLPFVYESLSSKYYFVYPLTVRSLWMISNLLVHEEIVQQRFSIEVVLEWVYNFRCIWQHVKTPSGEGALKKHFGPLAPHHPKGKDVGVGKPVVPRGFKISGQNFHWSPKVLSKIGILVPKSSKCSFLSSLCIANRTMFENTVCINVQNCMTNTFIFFEQEKDSLTVWVDSSKFDISQLRFCFWPTLTPFLCVSECNKRNFVVVSPLLHNATGQAALISSPYCHDQDQRFVALYKIELFEKEPNMDQVSNFIASDGIEDETGVVNWKLNSPITIPDAFKTAITQKYWDAILNIYRARFSQEQFLSPPSADALCRNYYTQVLEQEPDNLAQQLMFGALSELAKQ